MVYFVAAPFFFIGVPRMNFRWFAFTTPLRTVTVFTAIIAFLDVFVAALPVFLAAYLTGRVMGKTVN